MCFWGDMFDNSEGNVEAYPGAAAVNPSPLEPNSISPVNFGGVDDTPVTTALTDEGNGIFNPPPEEQGTPDPGADSAAAAAAQAPVVMDPFVVTPQDTAPPAPVVLDDTSGQDTTGPDPSGSGGQSGGGDNTGPIVLPPFIVNDTPAPPPVVPIATPDNAPPIVVPPFNITAPAVNTAPESGGVPPGPVKSTKPANNTKNQKGEGVPIKSIKIPPFKKPATAPAIVVPVLKSAATSTALLKISKTVKSSPIKVSHPTTAAASGGSSGLWILALIAGAFVLSSQDSAKK